MPHRLRITDSQIGSEPIVPAIDRCEIYHFKLDGVQFELRGYWVTEWDKIPVADRPLNAILSMSGKSYQSLNRLTPFRDDRARA